MVLQKGRKDSILDSYLNELVQKHKVFSGEIAFMRENTEGVPFEGSSSRSDVVLSDNIFPSTIEEVDSKTRVRHRRTSAKELYVDYYLQNNHNIYECEFIVWRQNPKHRNFTARYVRKTSIV